MWRKFVKSKIIFSDILTNIFSETAVVSEVSTLSDSILITTTQIKFNLVFSQKHSIFDKRDYNILRDLLFFYVKKSNIINFEYEFNTIWKLAWHDSEKLCWKNDKKYKDSVILSMINSLSKINFIIIISEFDDDSAY